MKKIQLVLLVIIISFHQVNVNAQIDSARRVFVGLTGGMSFFGPSGVNNYIKDALGNVTMEKGFPEIILNFNASFSIIYKINDRTDFSGIFDFALAPKMISTSDYSSGYTFDFYRFSPGALCNLYFGDEKDSKFFVGGGVLINFMGFEGYSALSPGLRLQLGQNIVMGSIVCKGMGVINIMPPVNGNKNGSTLELNYTDVGIVLGIEF